MLMLQGIVLGVKSRTRIDRDTGEEIVTYKVGIQTDKSGGYEGEYVTTDVQVTKTQMNQGVQAQYEGIRGQEVVVPVFVMPWASKRGNAGLTFFFEGDAKPLKVEPKK